MKLLESIHLLMSIYLDCFSNTMYKVANLQLHLKSKILLDSWTSGIMKKELNEITPLTNTVNSRLSDGGFSALQVIC